MTTSEGFIRYLLGPARPDIRPITVSIDQIVELLTRRPKSSISKTIKALANP